MTAGRRRCGRSNQQHLVQKVQSGDVVVDATCGRGHDTVKLGELVSSAGVVHAFDVQAVAIEASRQTVQAALGDACPTVHYHCMCHSRIAEVIEPGSVAVVAFNLGYLPSSSDKSVITTPVRTVSALQAACQVLKPGGLITVLAYIGHEGGPQEYEAVKEFAASLDGAWTTSESRLLNRSQAPVMFCMWKH